MSIALTGARIKSQTKLHRYKPYEWQKEFLNAGAGHPERMLMAANRVGKTDTAAAEIAIHVTGDYPEWWEGKRFYKGVLVWVGSVTNEASRDIVQKALLGGIGENLGTGYIPLGAIVGKPHMRQAGVSDVIDKVTVRHKSGGVSEIVFKTYDQGWKKWQGTEPEVVWLDEEPDQYKIFTECLTRTLTSHGVVLVTFTPLLGETELVRHFADVDIPGTYLKRATWDDAPHLSKAEKDRLTLSYPDYEVDARTTGVPILGEGRVWQVAEKDVKCDPFEIPIHFAHIGGVDFGIGHPLANAWIAWNRDQDIIYVYDCYRQKNLTPAFHVPIMNKRGTWIPIAWPHDGMSRDKGGGQPLYRIYLKEGASLLSRTARYDNEIGGAQPVEPIVRELYERMITGRFKVFSTCGQWFEEFRSYHRRDGQIVAVRDDILKATMYAVMMRRFAQFRIPRARKTRHGHAIVSTRVA